MADVRKATRSLPRQEAAEARPAPLFSRVRAAVVIGAVLYGSLIPFNIDFLPFHVNNAFGLCELTLACAGPEDVVTNLLVYLPVGLALVLCGDKPRSLVPRPGLCPDARRVALAVAIGTVVSLLAETLQTGLPARVASWTDVLLNSVGTAAGAILGVVIREFTVSSGPRMRAVLREHPFAVSATVLTFGLFLYHLIPFDFVSDTAGLRESFLRARWDLVTVRSGPFDEPPFALLAAQLSGAAWFAMLAYLRAFAGLQAEREAAVAWGSGVKHTVVLIIIIEFMRLFTVSNTFDVATIVLRSLAAVLGAWSAVYLVDARTGGAWRRQLGHAFPAPLLVIVASFQVAVILLGSVDPAGWGPPGGELAYVQWMPFETLWHGPASTAFQESLSLVLTHGSLAVTVAILLGRAGVSQAWPVAGVGVTLLAIAAEGLRGATAFPPPDITGPVLALTAVVLAWAVFESVAGREGGHSLCGYATAETPSESADGL